MIPEGKRKGGCLRRKVAAALAALLLLLLLTGCASRCSLCGQKTIFFDRVHIHGVELTICPDCQRW